MGIGAFGLFILYHLKKTHKSRASVLEISIQHNSKLNVEVQNVTRVIVESVKCAFEKFRVQSVIWGIV